MKAILAVERSGGLGYQGGMPWPKQDKDLQRFKELTTGTTVLMGRGTWESSGMPKPLPNRTNIVASNSVLDLPDGVIQIKELTPQDLLQVDWVIGGAMLVGSLWDQINEIHLSHLFAEYECDVSIDLEHLNKDFYCARSQLCLTHTYKIYRRRI